MSSLWGKQIQMPTDMTDKGTMLVAAFDKGRKGCPITCGIALGSRCGHEKNEECLHAGATSALAHAQLHTAIPIIRTHLSHRCT